MTDYAAAFRAAQAERVAHPTYPNWFLLTAEVNFTAARPLLRSARTALQIGAFTGDATVWLLDNLPGLRLTDVDTWLGSAESDHERFDWDDVYATYRRRTELYVRAGLLTIHRSTSDAFFDFRPEHWLYDFIYIDGSHETAQVAADAEHAHAALNPGGILAFDDYDWGENIGFVNSPRPAIDAFLDAHADDYSVLLSNRQVWLRRRRPS